MQEANMRTDDLVPNLRKGVYISPSKNRIPFDFIGQPEFEQSKKLSLQEIPMTNNWVVQDLGLGMLTFSIEMIFPGRQADKDCQEMIAALSETGSGMLMHPSGQDILCIATGWKYQPSSLSSVRLAKLAVNFIKTIKQPYPAIQQDYTGDIALAEKELLSPSKSLAEKIANFSQNDLINARRNIESLVNKTITPLRWLADTTKETSGLLAQAELELKNLLDLDAPLLQTLQSVGNIANIPSKASLDLGRKQQAYIDAIQAISVTNTPDDSVAETMRWQILQTLAIANCTCFENAQINSSSEAILFVTQNVDIYQNLLTNSSLQPDSLTQVLTMLNLSTNAMNTLSVSLPQRRSMTLTEDTTPIVAAYNIQKITGRSHSLDTFLSNNKLPADQILLIPRGKEIIWYGQA